MATPYTGTSVAVMFIAAFVIAILAVFTAIGAIRAGKDFPAAWILVMAVMLIGFALLVLAEFSQQERATTKQSEQATVAPSVAETTPGLPPQAFSNDAKING